MILKKSVTHHSSRLSTSLALSLSLIVAACGGGGGGEPVAATPSPSPAPAPTPSPSPAPGVNQSPVAALAVASPASPNLLTINTPVTLSATSTDPESQTLTHTWTLVSKPAGSTASLAASTGASVSFTPDRSGVYLVSIASSDGTNTATAQSSLEVVNSAPVASLAYVAPAPTTVTAGDTVNLRATSTDAEGEAMTHTWALTRPSGDTSATLSSASGATTSFVPAIAGTYSVRVSSTDGTSTTQSAAFTITVAAAATPAPPPPAPTPNTAPSGAMTLTVPSGTTLPRINSPVTYVAASTDTQTAAGSLTHIWTLVARPTNSTAVLTATTGATTTFTPDLPGTYTTRIVSSDGSLSSTAVTNSVVVANRAPVVGVALASTQSATVAVGEQVSLVATSTDADAQALTHTWTLTPPATGTNTLTAATTTVAGNSFRATVAGTYIVTLNSSDGIESAAAPATINVTVGAQPTEVACSSATSTPTVYRFQQPALVGAATSPVISVGTSSGTTTAAETRGNSACFHQTVLRDIRGVDQIMTQGGYYYFEATRTGAAHIGIAGAGAPTASALGEVTWPTDTANASFVLSPCDPITNGSAPGCLLSNYDAGSTPRTVGFAVDYRGNYPIVYVIGQPDTTRGDAPADCRSLVAGASNCVIASAALNTTGAVNIYAYGKTAGGVTGSVTINGGEAANYAIGADASRDALRRYRYEAGRGFDTTQWPRTADSAAMPTLPTITRGSHVNTVIRLSDASPFRGSISATAPAGTITWRNAAGQTLSGASVVGTTSTLPLHTAGTPISGLVAGDNRIEAVATVGQMSASVSYTVRFAPAAPAADEDWDGDGVPYETEKTNGTDPANPDSNNDGIADGVTATAVAGFASNTALVHTAGVASPGAVLSDDSLSAAFTSLVNPKCVADAAAGTYAALSRETCNKRGVMTNFGVTSGSFRYYEVRKRSGAANVVSGTGVPIQGPNMGAGVITAGAVNPEGYQWGLDPYGYAVNPLSNGTPYSASFNFAVGTYYRLFSGVNGSRSDELTSLRGYESEYVGVLVDYRGAEPSVRFVFNEVQVGGTQITRVSFPVSVVGFTGTAFPTIFGHPMRDNEIAQEANFGLKPFFYDTGTRNLSTALAAAGLSAGDISALQLGVGRNTRPKQ